MGRHKDSYSGERLTISFCVQLTPTQREELGVAAEAHGATVSEYVRDQLFHKGGKYAVVGGMRRNREAKALLNELRKIGDSLNQLARQANANGLVDDQRELNQAIHLLKRSMTKVAVYSAVH